MKNTMSHTADQIDKLAEYLGKNGLPEASHFLGVAAISVREAENRSHLFGYRDQADGQLDLMIPLLAMNQPN